MNLHGKDIKIFAANSVPHVAEQIARHLGLPLGDAEVKTFSDGEIAVSINESVRGSDVFVVQSTCSPVNDHLMELLIMIDAFKRASAGRITAVIPYYGYARQDRKAKSRDPISAKLVADLITAAGTDRVLTMDLHAAQIQGFFDIPVDHLQGVPLLAPYFVEKFKDFSREDLVVVSPDLGSVTRARKFADRLGAPIAIIDKRRPRPNVSEVMNICNAAAALVERGGAKEVYGCATHGVLSGPAIERIENSVFKEMVLLDTIPVRDNSCKKIVQLPVAPLFADAIERIYEDQPVSPLFN